MKIFAATQSDPDKNYLGLPEAGGGQNWFKGMAGFWVVHDRGAMNHPRLVEDEEGRPKGFKSVRIGDNEVLGYMVEG